MDDPDLLGWYEEQGRKHRGSVTIHGRSDATLNRNGIRMGSADIYEVVEAIPEVLVDPRAGTEEGDSAPR